MASRKGEYDHAIGLLDKAVRLEDGLNYIEPPDWGLPVRHLLGAVLLEAGRPREAETVYWEDLRRNPENGWALFGLSQALLRQNKNEQAKVIDKRFRRAWPEADVQLVATRF
ncbi:MAG: hypothetical protein GWN67_20560 [Phycisphaerae bacterium]|nr:tetratricopeptide repeat protein [Phycisphaerae bacterium]NIU58687.1 hypothetical protein [Phycisphaerae bacterium]NIW92792.1 hypothetical protein [Phycisphaerae bacterium]